MDDHPAVRQGLALLLATDGIDVSAEAADRAEAIALLNECRPDLAIVDLSLEKEDGTLLIAELCARGVPALVYSMHKDVRHVEGALAAGALGYVAKRELHAVLVEGIREVAERRRFLSPTAAMALAQHATPPQIDAGVGVLSEQEWNVYRLVGQGEGTFEIAAALSISTRTVESYCARMLVKLGLDGMHALRHHAITHVHRDQPG